jgi:glycosyltransferase involved in cell wall biosynthesis
MHVKLLVEFVTKHRPEVINSVYFYVPAETGKAVSACLTADAARWFCSRMITAAPAQARRSLKGVMGAARSVGATDLLLLEIDSYIYSLAIRSLPVTVSGVWFRATYHYGSTAMMYEGWRQRAGALLKRLTAKILCSRSSIRQLFVFDPWAVEYAVTRLRTEKIIYVPDPFAFPGIRYDLTHATCNERLVFSIVGSISRRKGILAVLGALRALPPSDQRKAELRIIGRVAQSERTMLSTLLERVRRDTEVAIHQVDEFVSDEAIDAAIINSDVVLLPYQRFAGSSGILIRAALYGKPVLATKFGLVGALVIRHKLGLTLDPYDENAIAAALSKVLAFGRLALDKDSASRFAAEHLPDHYGAALCRLIQP